jgi:TPR repeat protein
VPCKVHADKLKRVLFEGDLASESQLLDMGHWMAKHGADGLTSAALWLEKGKGLLNQERWIEAHECFIAGLKIEPVHPEIMYWMGVLCNDGSEIAEKLGVDWRTLPFSAWDSDQWFQRSAQAGWAEAQFKCYELSRSGVAAGIECLRNAAGQGHARAAWELTLRILSGDVDRSGLDDAAYWFYQAKAGGVGKFSETLGPVRRRQQKQNDNLFQDWLLKAAPYGDGEAALELARFQFMALGLEDSLDEVVNWLEKAEIEGKGTVEESLKKFRAERRKQQCENAVAARDGFAFAYAEWADRSPFEFILCFDDRLHRTENQQAGSRLTKPRFASCLIDSAAEV